MIDDEKRGKFLSELRKNRHLTQKELGDLIHYSDKNISKWERGISFPSNPNVLNEIADIFNISVEELIYGEKLGSYNKEKIRKNFINVYKNNYNRYRKKVNFLVVSILLIIIGFLISIYIIFIRNSIKVYTIAYENNNISMLNSTLLITNKINILNFNKISTKRAVEKIRMYYINEDNKTINIFAGANKDYYIEENNGYSEYYLQNLLNNKVYLEIIYEDNEEEIVNLIFEEKYTNDNIFPRKIDNILEKRTTSLNESLKDKLLDIDFIDYESYLEKQIAEKTTCIYDVESNNFIISIVKDDVIEKISSRVGLDNISYEKLVNGELVQNKELNIKEKKNCDLESCSSIEDFAMYISYLKEI